MSAFENIVIRLLAAILFRLVYSGFHITRKDDIPDGELIKEALRLL
jgi:hypothetical protein